MIDRSKIRNVAIIAHVDHGKTTLVDQLFRQSGMFRSNQVVEERLMDSMDLEKERGITIQAKNGSCTYNDYLINIVDTPGHADFGGEVERVLFMADGVLFLVDALEGPMPQSYFVLKKALAKNLPIIVIVNKIDKPSARPDWVVDQVFDLLVKLGAPDHILDFKVIYASAKDGYAYLDGSQKTDNVDIIFKYITKYLPSPKGDINAPLQLLVSTISYSSFLGRLAIGKITEGQITIGQQVALAIPGEVLDKKKITKIYQFESNKQITVEKAAVGDIVAVAGIDDIRVGHTITDIDNPNPLPSITVDPPTLSMLFLPNDSPFAGLDGSFVTSRHLRKRLYSELLSDVALTVTDAPDGLGYTVSGRGELHLAILIEKMRREGYEFQVAAPQVILKEKDGKKLEPYEEVSIEVSEDRMGKVIEKLNERKGQLLHMDQASGMVHMLYKIPTRGLLGYVAEFMTDTKGMGTINSLFSGYEKYVGNIRTRNRGVIVVKENCTTVAYALYNLQERMRFFLGPGEKVYQGQIIGENSREGDLVINPSKGKKLTNVRASGTDDAVLLTPHVKMSLEQNIVYIDDTELVEFTPKSIRLRKKLLNEHARKRNARERIS